MDRLDVVLMTAVPYQTVLSRSETVDEFGQSLRGGVLLVDEKGPLLAFRSAQNKTGQDADRLAHGRYHTIHRS